MLPEKRVEEAIKAYVRDTPLSFVEKIHAGMEQGRNTLDLIGAYEGKPFMVEVKKKGGKSSDMQDYLVKRAIKCGYVAGVVESLEEFIMLFGERGH